MAVPSTFADLNTTPASNSGLVSDSTAVNQIDNHLQSVYALIASIYANSGNGWASPYLSTANPSYTGTLTGGTGVVNLGSGQFVKDSSGNIGIGRTASGAAVDVQSDANGIVRVRGGAGTNQGAGFFGTSGSDATRFAFGQVSRIFGGTPGDNAAVYALGYIAIAPGGVETARFDTAGNLVIANTSAAPSTPAAGVLYVESGALKYRGSSGTVTTIAPA